jgi:uncharacterized protein (TIGR02594 family)
MTTFTSAVFHKDIRTVEFTAANGDRMLRSGGTIAWLLNNPGNLRPSAKYKGVVGEAQTKSGKFAIFENEAAGRAEKKALLKRKYDNMTLRTAIFTYAPESENDSEAYLAFVRKRAGVTDNVVLKDMSDAQFNAMMAAMEQYEGFNARKDTRKEEWVHVTTVTLSDGARPHSNLPVVRQSALGGTQTIQTNESGLLPPFITRTPGEQVTLSTITGVVIGMFDLGARSRALVFSGDLSRVAANADLHLPPANPKPQARPQVRYVIQPGDNLDTIARRFKTTVSKIMADNGTVIRNASRIYPGQVIWLYGAAPRLAADNGSSPTAKAAAPGATPAATKVRHTVKTGESLSAIAQAHGTTLDKVVADNPGIRNPRLIHPGQIVLVTPGKPGAAPRAASPKPTAKPTPAKKPTATPAPAVAAPRAAEVRSRESAGHPLGVVPFSQQRAPWIEHAYSEAQRWKGKKEGTIDKTINYHHELGTKWLPSMSGTDNAWCASYVNWCLRKAGYAVSNPHYRARSFHGDANFHQITAPIFGAVAMKGTSHVGFVYAKSSTGSIILLGGNQGDQINFTAFKSTGLRFYVPLTYVAYANKELKEPKLDVTTAATLNNALGITVNVKASGNER